jgi:hypothetical protein
MDGARVLVLVDREKALARGARASYSDAIGVVVHVTRSGCAAFRDDARGRAAVARAKVSSRTRAMVWRRAFGDVRRHAAEVRR